MLADAIAVTAALTIVGIITYRMRGSSEPPAPDPAETEPVILATPAQFSWFQPPSETLRAQVPCKECRGSGLRYVNLTGRWADCTPCDGTGREIVRAKKRHPTSRIPRQRNL